MLAHACTGTGAVLEHFWVQGTAFFAADHKVEFPRLQAEQGRGGNWHAREAKALHRILKLSRLSPGAVLKDPKQGYKATTIYQAAADC